MREVQPVSTMYRTPLANLIWQQTAISTSTAGPLWSMSQYTETTRESIRSSATPSMVAPVPALSSRRLRSTSWTRRSTQARPAGGRSADPREDRPVVGARLLCSADCPSGARGDMPPARPHALTNADRRFSGTYHHIGSGTESPWVAPETGTRVVPQWQLDRPASLTECLLYRHDSAAKWRMLRSWPFGTAG